MRHRTGQASQSTMPFLPFGLAERNLVVAHRACSLGQNGFAQPMLAATARGSRATPVA